MGKIRNMTEINDSSLVKDTIIEAMLERKAKDVVAIDLRELEQSVADYFVVCHGESNVQVAAVAEFVERHVKSEIKEQLLNKEGLENSQWVLLDYGSVVVHVFQQESRSFYNLEDLWADGVKESIKEE